MRKKKDISYLYIHITVLLYLNGKPLTMLYTTETAPVIREAKQLPKLIPSALFTWNNFIICGVFTLNNNT